jgi:geranylgeranyl diphosphate synthase, type I
VAMTPALPDFCASWRAVVSVELQRVLETCPSGLGDMLRYHMGWRDAEGHSCNQESGKFVRSTLCLVSCEAVNGEGWRLIPAAAALELIHNFSLIHDDVQDASPLRHHRPAIWRLWGQSQAINAGDAMFTLAYLALLKLNENGFTDNQIATATQVLSLACLELCEGQYLDIEYENRVEITVDDYLDMASKKTAALLAVSASLGAFLGGGCDKVVNSLHLFGRELGMAYQICDDLMGIWGTEEDTGKPADDILHKKKTLPVVYALQNSKGKEHERLRRLYAQESIGPGDVQEIAGILERTGARDYARNLSEQCYGTSIAQLEVSGLEVTGQARLKEIACALMNRRH